MSAQHVLDHNSNIYLAVTVSPSSHVYENPAELATRPELTYVGQVGQLRDVHLLSIPRDDWSQTQADVLSAIRNVNGVQRVDVQEAPRTRTKRDVADL